MRCGSNWSPSPFVTVSNQGNGRRLLNSRMYCASFIWEPGTYDAEFHRLNNLIKNVAESSNGFLGSESWQSADGSRKCANYYWSDLETLRTFSINPIHKEAKKQYARWY